MSIPYINQSYAELEMPDSSERWGGRKGEDRQWLLPRSNEAISSQSQDCRLIIKTRKTIASATYHPFKIGAHQVRHNQGRGSRS